jgi:hypothetical protein
MSAFEIRLFPDDASIVAIGEGLLGRTLPREAWTHEAHLAACTWIVRNRPDIVPARDMRDIISSYNVAVGGINDDGQGYHETITQVYLAAVETHLADVGPLLSLHETVNSLLLSPRGRRELPLRFYSKELLFSVTARRGFVPPDLGTLADI